uniref:Uncharacterized protein n=1 Tax=Solanum tuberosum TaxID=4113 RepID=M1BEI0_SOLTU
MEIVNFCHSMAKSTEGQSSEVCTLFIEIPTSSATMASVDVVVAVDDDEELPRTSSETAPEQVKEKGASTAENATIDLNEDS